MLSQNKNINWNYQDYKGCTTAMYGVEGCSKEYVQILSQIKVINSGYNTASETLPM